MTPAARRVRSILIIGALLIIAVVVPAICAYQLGMEYVRDQREDELEQRVANLETDVSLLRE